MIFEPKVINYILFILFESTDTDSNYNKIITNRNTIKQTYSASQLNQWKAIRRIPKQSLLLENQCSWSLQPEFNI